MKLGRFTIEQLNEGQFEFFRDGRINRTPVSETENRLKIPAKRALVGINPIYVSDGEHHILLDTGLGWGLDAGSSYANVSNICTNLDIFGVQAEDVTHVVLTHLHYDHSAGLSYTGQEAITKPTFPNAQYYVQQAEWDFAVKQMQMEYPNSPFYRLDDLYRLYADSFFEFLDENSREIIPGIQAIKTGGHTPGHQIVKISAADQSAYFWGDLLADSAHLDDQKNIDPHVDMVQAKKVGIQMMRQAYEEKAIVFLYHSVSSKPCRLKRDKDKNYVLEEIG